MLKWLCVRGLGHCEWCEMENFLHGGVSISQLTRSSPGVRVLPREAQAGGGKEGPFGLHKVERG